MEPLERVTRSLAASYAGDTAVNDRWTVDNPSYGHCTIAALVVAKYLKARIVQVEIPEPWASRLGYRTHHYNLVGRTVHDATRQQFPQDFPYEALIQGHLGVRRLVASRDIARELRRRHVVHRYQLLAERTAHHLARQ